MTSEVVRLYDAIRSGTPPCTHANDPYAGLMTVSAHDIAAVLRQRIPNLNVLKLHKLLYYCQGHHLAAFGEPLFREDVFAWDNGPVVPKLRADERDGLSAPPGPPLGEAELNTIGYVLSRYGKLTPNDLINMTHQEQPWRLADAGRIPGTSRKITRQSMAAYFAGEGAPDDGADDLPLDSDTIREMFADATPPDPRSGRVDTLEGLRAWAERRSA